MHYYFLLLRHKLLSMDHIFLYLLTLKLIKYKYYNNKMTVKVILYTILNNTNIYNIEILTSHMERNTFTH